MLAQAVMIQSLKHFNTLKVLGNGILYKIVKSVYMYMYKT